MENALGRQSRRLDKAVVQIAGELIAESWHDLAGIRTALYVVNEKKSSESMAIIAIVDQLSRSFLYKISKDGACLL